MKTLLKALFAVLMIGVLGSCGGGESGSKIYKNGYKEGYDYGQSDVMQLKKLTEPSKHGYITSGQFQASTSYELWKGSLASFQLDESDESEYRSGWIAGYNDGVEAQLGGSGKDNSSEVGAFNRDSSDSEEKTGINFWQWCIILLVVFFIIGALTPDDKTTNVAKKEDESLTSSNEKDTTESNKAEETVSPWKSLLLAFLACVFFFVIDVIFVLTSSDKSTYSVLLLTLIMAYLAYENATKYRAAVRKNFLSGFVKIFSAIIMIFVAYLFVLNIWEFFFA